MASLKHLKKNFFQFNKITNTEQELTILRQTWNQTKAQYQQQGQYVDYRLMMATAIVLNIDIHIHGGIDTLLKVEGRTSRFTINLLYSAFQTDLNRGNHYDLFTPNIKPPICTELLTTFPRNSEWITEGKKIKPIFS